MLLSRRKVWYCFLSPVSQGKGGFGESNWLGLYGTFGSDVDMSPFIQSLSSRLFWDVDPNEIDEQAHCRYIIQRVLERGTLDDIRATISYYTMPFMIAEAQQIRFLDPVTLAFAACIGNVKEETFRCCSSKH